MCFVKCATSLAVILHNSWAFFHDASNGAETLRQFRDASDGRLVTVSAAEHGLDIPDVDRVIHSGMPDCLTATSRGRVEAVVMAAKPRLFCSSDEA